MSGKRDKRQRNSQPSSELNVDEHVVLFDETGEAICTMAELNDAQEDASEDDRLWFEAHPAAKGRLREYIPFEMPIATQRCQHVFVRQFEPGRRMRQPLVPEWHPFTYFRVDPDTGEVLGKYSDAEAWQDRMFQQLKQLIDNAGL